MTNYSSSEYIEQTSNKILNAFEQFKVEADNILRYDDLFPYLDRDSAKHRDWLKDAEQNLRKEGYITPDADGLRLTEVVHNAIYNKSV